MKQWGDKVKARCRYAAVPLVATIMLLCGCQVATPTGVPTTMPTEVAPGVPKLIGHPRPALEIDEAIYDNVGCDPDKGCATAGTPLASIGCEYLWSASWWLGGLTPSYPIAQCGWSEPGPEGLYRGGCTPPHTQSGLVVLREGQYQLVASLEQLRALYVPIESEDEALSYAMAATGLGARFSEDIPAGWKLEYLAQEIEDTHVTPSEGGYRVNLYWWRACGCGKHEYRPVDVRVTVDGTVSTSALGEPAYRDAREICID
jgi:hypothetical protein